MKNMNAIVLFAVVLCFCTSLFLILYGLSVTSKSTSVRRRKAGSTCSTAIFLGSGGHTTEMFLMLAALDLQRYKPRVYLISEGDQLSAEKARVFENQSGNKEYKLVYVPRARRVHQPLVTTLPFITRSLFASLRFLRARAPEHPAVELLLLNGPATGLILCIAVTLCRVLRQNTPRMIYIESFAKVSSLSLSGRFARPLVDRFIVQWPKLSEGASNALHTGWLI